MTESVSVFSDGLVQQQTLQNAVVRPTEAQLRWAQFHHHRQAVQLRESLDRFWQTPARASDVAGALPEDAKSSSDESNPDAPYRKRRPRISKGRRALLRVSKRAFESRRLDIQKRAESRDDEDEDALEMIFAEESFLKRKRQRRKTAYRNQDRIRRFEDAFHAMMLNLASLQPQRHEIEAPSRVWTRPEGLPGVSMDYSLLQWGISDGQLRPNKEFSGSDCSLPTSFDMSVGGDNIYIRDGAHSPVRQRFKDIVTDFQNRLGGRSGPTELPDPAHHLTPTMRLSKYFIPARLDDDGDEKKQDDTPAKRYLSNQFAKVMAASPNANTEKQLEKVLASIDPTLLQEMEELDPGVLDRLRALYLGEASPNVKTLAARLESPPRNHRNRSTEEEKGLVEGLVSSIERVIVTHDEKMVSADGKLRKAAFANMVNQYLGTAKPTTRLQPISKPTRRSTKIAQLAEEITSQLNDCGDDGASTLVDSETGTLDRQALEDLVTRYLAEASGVEEEIVRLAPDWATLVCGDEDYGDDDYGDDEAAIDVWTDDFLVHMSKVSGLRNEATIEENVRTFVGMYDFPIDSTEPLIQELVEEVKAAWFSGNVSYQDFCDAVRYHFSQFWMRHCSVGTDNTENQGFMLSSQQVEDIIAKLQQAAAVERLLNSRGHLDVGVVKSLVQRYLAASSPGQPDKDFLQQARSPLALAQVRRSVGTWLRPQELGDPDSGILDHEQTERFLEVFVALLEQESAKLSLNRSDGSVDRNKFEQLLRRCFAPSAYNLTNSVNSRKGTFLSSAVHVETPKGQSSTRSSMSTVSEQFGGFMRRLYRSNDGEPAREEPDSEILAFAAFRKQRDGKGASRSRNDETSSTSSFRALPEGFKSIVKRLSSQSSTLPDRDEGASGGFRTPERHGHHSAPPYSDAHSSDFSPEKARLFHQKIMEKSALLKGEKFVIDTDGTEVSGYQPASHGDLLASLLLSPTILTKRHRQAIRAIENRSWDQVQYLLSANPWLAEMPDVTTKQYLLHKVALYGAGVLERGRVVSAAPMELNTEMIALFPSAVHKFDQLGNLPLHMAAASSNSTMAHLLCQRFPSGATVRNEDGLLPLHLAVLACASPLTPSFDNPEEASEIVRTILSYSPRAVAVTDNVGNLPIHTAVAVLQGEVAIDVIYILLDEAARQIEDPFGARFRNKIKMTELENMSSVTDATETPTDSSNVNLEDVVLPCTLVRNDLGENPLQTAIRARASWNIIEALAQGGPQAVLDVDDKGNNALHWLVGDRHPDPTGALSLLKIAPQAACQRNNDGMLPIELACIHGFPSQVILAIVLVDLPVDIETGTAERRPGYGESWWYLACDCDDFYFDLIAEVVGICTPAQVRELGLMENAAGEPLIRMAAPKSRAILQKSLRFLGRFEVKAELAVDRSKSGEVISRVFEAVDFGPSNGSRRSGKNVLLKLYHDQARFEQETNFTLGLAFDFSLVEEVHSVYDTGPESSQQFGIYVVQPELTLAGVVSGMLSNEDCQNDSDTRRRYALKALAVLRVVAKAMAHLHSLGVVHGKLSLHYVGKYGSKWKIAGVSGVQRVGSTFDVAKLTSAAPPEAIVPKNRHSSRNHEAMFRNDLTVDCSFDVWSFGKLAFEVLAGKTLTTCDEDDKGRMSGEALMDIMHWNGFSLEGVREELTRACVVDSAIDLITRCLTPEQHLRLSSMDVVEHNIWRDIRRGR